MCSDDQKAQRVAVIEQDRSPLFRCDLMLIAPLHIHTADISIPALPTASELPISIAGDHFLVKGRFQQQIPFIQSKINCSGTWSFPIIHKLRGFGLLSLPAHHGVPKQLPAGLWEADASLSQGSHSVPAHSMTQNGEELERRGNTGSPAS